jgi:MFS family permease
VHGLVDPFILVPSLPEMIESVLPLYPESAESQINDISSGIFNMFLGIGQVAGPLFGSIVSKYLGFRMTCDLVAVICLLFSISYYVFTDGAEAMRKSKWI